ncbi:MAG TPA: hypothetical protein VF414_01605 [Thermoanaerobaculia bacterium]
MTAGPARPALAYGAAFLAGAVLFFLVFAAAFNGSWTLLAAFLLCYGAAGALTVRLGRVAAAPVALALVAPALPWVLWLFPASIPEAGLARALLWPGLVLVGGGLGWVGGRIAARGPVRPPAPLT